MDREVMVVWRGDRGGVGSCVGMHSVTVIEIVIQVTMITVIIRGPQGLGVLVVMGGSCQ